MLNAYQILNCSLHRVHLASAGSIDWFQGCVCSMKWLICIEWIYIVLQRLLRVTESLERPAQVVNVECCTTAVNVMVIATEQDSWKSRVASTDTAGLHEVRVTGMMLEYSVLWGVSPTPVFVKLKTKDDT